MYEGLIEGVSGEILFVRLDLMDHVDKDSSDVIGCIKLMI